MNLQQHIRNGVPEPVHQQAALNQPPMIDEWLSVIKPNTIKPVSHNQDIAGSEITSSYIRSLESGSARAWSTSSSSEDADILGSPAMGNEVINKNIESPEFYPIACENCRKQHRRCDRRLPSCVNCTSRGATCVYRESKRSNKSTTEEKKRKKKKPLTTFVPKDSAKASDPKFKPYKQPEIVQTFEHASSEPREECQEFFEGEEQGHLSKRNVIDFYYEIASDGYPLIERKELEHYILTPQNEENKDLFPHKKEMFALFLSIRSLCECRYGLTELAEKTAQRAKSALSKMFDQFENYFLACTYGNLAIYEGWSGRYQNSKFYIQILSFFIKAQYSDESKREKMSDCEKNLESLIFYFDKILGDDLQKLSTQAIVYRMPEIYYFLTGETFPEQWTAITQQEITQDNCFEIWSVIEMTIEKFKKISKEGLESPNSMPCMSCFKYGSEYIAIVDPLFALIIGALRISIISKSSNLSVRDIIERTALEITSITEHTYYPLFPPDVLPCVAKAAHVHLTMVNSMMAHNNFVHNNVDYFEILQKDLRAFNVMSKRYKFVPLYFKDLVSEIEQAISLVKTRRVVTELCLDRQQNSIEEEIVAVDPEISDYISVPFESGGIPFLWDMEDEDFSAIFPPEQ